MTLVEETIGKGINHYRKKTASCCKMNFYYGINVSFEVKGYLFSRGSLQFCFKNYLKEQCYNAIMKISLPRKIIFCAA